MRNGISSAQAYAWYRDFTRDVVDAIRAVDRNHLVFLGAQYLAELVDWEYRPDGDPLPEPVPRYRHLARQMLEACSQRCWNVWSLTSYDFTLYALDDAALFGQAGVAVVATEHGFTLGNPNEQERRFGGDRAAAVCAGLARPWRDLDGRCQERLPSVVELVGSGTLMGIAPWGAPAPGPGSRVRHRQHARDHRRARRSGALARLGRPPRWRRRTGRPAAEPRAATPPSLGRR